MPSSATHKPGKPVREIPFWLLAIGLIGVMILWGISADYNYATIFKALSSGVLTTVWVTLIAFVLASALGLVLALMRQSRSRILREIATFYIEIVRGIPILVLLFYIAFVGTPWFVSAYNDTLFALGLADTLPALSVRQLDFTWRAIIALMLAYAAFLAEIFRAGLEAVDRGQIEAAQALGLKRFAIFRLISGPQAFRIILPPYGNDFVSMIKDSALVSALGVQDITQLGKVFSASTFKFFETYNIVAFLYLAMTISLSLLIRMVEKRIKRTDIERTNR
ncbi:MAG: amino acid ABC transporter permease [Alphaproteobacteria bacterium]|nr:amino acid ABC transporter permease [Alphaproteobacteria bacterium]